MKSRNLIVALMICLLAGTTILPVAGESAVKESLNGEKTKSNMVEWGNFKLIHGDSWNVDWNPMTGAPTRMHGFHADLGKEKVGITSLTNDNIEKATRYFIAENSELFRTKDLNLKLVKADYDTPFYQGQDGSWYVYYRQHYNGLPVYGSYMSLIIIDEKVVWACSDVHPDISVSTEPRILQEEAQEIVKNELGLKGELFEAMKTSLIIFPEENDNKIEYHLAWKVETPLIRDPLGAWTYFIDANTGRVIQVLDELRYADASGTVTGNITPEYSGQTPIQVPFAHLNVSNGSDELNGVYYSGKGNNLANNMYTTLDLTGDTWATLNFSTKYDIESGDFVWVYFTQDFEIIYYEEYNGTQSDWTTESLDISYFVGNQWYVGFYYETDESGVGNGFFIDNIQVNTNTGTMFSDDGESGPDQWVMDGFNSEYDYPIDITTQTDSSGSYVISDLTGNVDLISELEGPYVNVNNEDRIDAIHNHTETVPFSYNWNWNTYDDSSMDEESNMFYHVNKVHDFFTNSSPFDITAMDYQMVATVEFWDNFDNAFYFNENIYFGNGSTLGNLALMSDVIYHEYTHGVVHHVYTTELPYEGQTGAMDEAWADYFACTINNNPVMTEGMPSEYRRYLNNSLRYPDDWVGEVHDDSRILSGAMWDIRTMLGADLADSLIIRAMKLEPHSFTGFAEAVLTVDDDNGDLSDGTPHSEQIKQAFYDNHGISTIYFFKFESNSYSNVTDVIIPDNGGWVTSTITVPEPDNVIIKDILVYVGIQHIWISDLQVNLTSPGGTSVRLHNGTGGSTENIYCWYDNETAVDGPGFLEDFNDEPSAGTWTLSVRDTYPEDTGKIDEWKLNLYHATAPDVTANSPIDVWVNNGTVLHLNATITDIGSGVKNATVNVSGVNNTITTAVLSKTAGDYWTNDSIIIDTTNSGLQNLTITAYDNAGNMNDTVNLTVKVDNTPPVVIANPTGYPDGFSAANNGTRIALNASISDTGAGIKNPTVNVSPISSTLGDIQLFNISGFWINDSVIVEALDGTYLLNITAYDNASNYNDSAQVKVIVDNSMPIIYSANANPSEIEANGTDNTLLNVTAIDDGSGIASVSVNLSAIGGSPSQAMINNSGVWQFTTNTTTVGTFELPVNVTDNAGNSNTSVNILLNAVDTTLPVVIDTSPINLATNVKIDTNITAAFCELMNSSTLNNNTVKVYSLDKIIGKTFKDTNGSWNYSNFEGFTLAEELTVWQTPIDDTHRIIREGNLTYSSHSLLRDYLVYSNEGLEVENSGNYSVIGWLGEEHVVVDNLTSKWIISRFIFEQNSTDTKTLHIGETWNLGDGYSLKWFEVDVDGNEAWLALNNSSGEINNQTCDNQSAYNYSMDLGAPADFPVFVTYLNKVNLDVNDPDNTFIELKYTWLVSQDTITILDGESFDIFDADTYDDKIVLESDDDVLLTNGSTIPLFDDFKFEVEDTPTVRYCLIRQTGMAVEGDISYNSASRTVAFDPISNLEYNTTYTSFIKTGAEDLAGNGLMEDYEWEFKTMHYTHTPAPTPSRNGGGGGGGGGASGEDYYNIVQSETDRQSVFKNSRISYRFDLEDNIVKYINFTALNSAGTVAAKVEILNNTSTLVSVPPPHEVYKNLNIWVGNYGWATEKNMAGIAVSFMVEKSWVTENDIDESTIALYRYSDDTWNKLVTGKTGEDPENLYFEAEVSGFSPFAVAGQKKTVEVIPTQTPVAAPSPEVTATVVETAAPSAKPAPIGLILFILILLGIGVVAYLKKDYIIEWINQRRQ